MNNPAYMIKSFFIVGGWTMISRLAGLVRDLLMAAYLGTGTLAEAFQAAFSLPNLFRRFFAEGAFNLAFVPLYSKKLATDADHDDFATDAVSNLAGILILLMLVAQLFMPFFILAMASGFRGDERFDIAVDLSRIIFPYIFFISMAAVFSGILNAHRHFKAAAVAPVFLNIILISVLVLAGYFKWDMGVSLSWGVLGAGVVQMGIVWLAVCRLGVRIKWRLPKLTHDMKRLFIIAMPAVLTGGVIQINLLVGRQIASYYEGAFAWLYYADRLYQLPLGVIGIAVGSVLLPELSQRLQNHDEAAGQQAYSRALEFTLILTLPAAVALVVIPYPLISVLFERAVFTAHDSAQTAMALAIYGFGLPAFVLQKILQPLYFARENTKTPFKFAVVTMFLNAILAIGLSYYYGFIAAALGTTISSWAMVLMLYIGARSMGQASKADQQFRRKVPRIILASTLMGLLIYTLEYILNPWVALPGVRYIVLIILIMAGVISYGFFCWVLGVLKPRKNRYFSKK